jgi:protein-disulfide isomerase-like protein with CxxC motif
MATHYSAGANRPAPTVHKDPVLTTVTAEEPLCPHQRALTQASCGKGRKEVICNTTRTLQEATYPAYPSLINTAGNTVENIKNPNYRGTSD